MEMCYDGALVMPSSCALMSEDEMTYVEGGGTKKYYNEAGTLANTCRFLVGIWNLQNYAYGKASIGIMSAGAVAANICHHNAVMMSLAERKCKQYKSSQKITLTIKSNLMVWINSVSTKKGK